jgi:hypothetical protein
MSGGVRRAVYKATTRRLSGRTIGGSDQSRGRSEVCCIINPVCILYCIFGLCVAMYRWQTR